MTRPYYDLVIIVPSHWSAEAERIVIRDTWWRYFGPRSACEICHKYRVKPLFLVGMQGAEGTRDTTAALGAEMQKWEDVSVLPEYTDMEIGYDGGAAKMMHCVRYVIDHYDFRVLLKADEHTFVFGDRLLARLAQEDAFSPGMNLYMGNFQQGLQQSVTEADRAFFDYTGLYTYPLHAEGPSYILTYSLVNFLAYPSVRFRPFLLDDKAVGVYLMTMAHLKADINISFYEGGCKELGSVMDNSVQTHIMRRRWRRYELFGDACLEPSAEMGGEAFQACLPEDPYRLWRRGKAFDEHRARAFANSSFRRSALEDPDLVLAHNATRSGTYRLDFHWRSREWRECSSGRRWRCVHCVGNDGRLYDEYECLALTMPASYQNCSSGRRLRGRDSSEAPSPESTMQPWPASGMPGRTGGPSFGIYALTLGAAMAAATAAARGSAGACGLTCS